MAKKRYKGVFNWQGEIHECWCRAFHPDSAFTIMCSKLAKELKLTSYTVRNYFYGTNKYTITEE